MISKKEIKEIREKIKRGFEFGVNIETTPKNMKKVLGISQKEFNQLKKEEIIVQVMPGFYSLNKKFR